MRQIFQDVDSSQCAVNVTLNFGEVEYTLPAQIQGREVILLCDDSCLLLKGWLMEYHGEVLQIVRENFPDVNRIKIYVNSHLV